jgi:hypothetical protein
MGKKVMLAHKNLVAALPRCVGLWLIMFLK